MPKLNNIEGNILLEINLLNNDFLMLMRKDKIVRIGFHLNLS